MRRVWIVSASLALLVVGCPEPPPGPVATAAPVPKALKRKGLVCTIQGSPTCEAGQAPQILVTVSNNTDRDIYLVHCLDASDRKGRYPHCYFEVTGPDGNPLKPVLGGCGNMNTLRGENFVRVPPGEVFNPYGEGNYGFYPHLSYGLFRTPGEYRIRFVYSTESDDLKAWAGDGKEKVAANQEITTRFEQVPRVEIRSEEFTVTVTAKGK